MTVPVMSLLALALALFLLALAMVLLALAMGQALLPLALAMARAMALAPNARPFLVLLRDWIAFSLSSTLASNSLAAPQSMMG